MTIYDRSYSGGVVVVFVVIRQATDFFFLRIEIVSMAFSLVSRAGRCEIDADDA